MDGNGRWAQRRGYPRVWGHIRGSAKVKAIVRKASNMGVKVLTLYAFSTENWSRPQPELDVLWKLLKKYLIQEADELDKENVRIRVIGEIERLSPDVRQVLDPIVERLSKNTGLQLVFAISYGAHKELARAAQSFAADCVSGKMKPEQMSETLMEKYLWTHVLGDLSGVDLVIRTSGEKRMSNFLLWQASYAEYYFTETCWPDFTVADFVEAVEDF
jgi:undecaprenyl diphosphate synthase